MYHIYSSQTIFFVNQHKNLQKDQPKDLGGIISSLKFFNTELPRPKSVKYVQAEISLLILLFGLNSLPSIEFSLSNLIQYYDPRHISASFSTCLRLSHNPAVRRRDEGRADFSLHSLSQHADTCWSIKTCIKCHLPNDASPGYQLRKDWTSLCLGWF